MGRLRTTASPNPFLRLRTLAKLSQAEAARRVGVSRSLWLSWERRERPVNISQLGQIRSVFTLDLDDVSYLLEWWGDIHPAQEVSIARLNALLGDRTSAERAAILLAYWGPVPPRVDPLTKAEEQVLSALRSTAPDPSKRLNVSVRTGLGARVVRAALDTLESRGLVRHLGGPRGHSWALAAGGA